MLTQTQTAANAKHNLQKGAVKGTKNHPKLDSGPPQNRPGNSEKLTRIPNTPKFELAPAKPPRGEWDFGPQSIVLD